MQGYSCKNERRFPIEEIPRLRVEAVAGVDYSFCGGLLQSARRSRRVSRIKMAIDAGTDESAQVVFSFGERIKAALAGELKFMSVGEVDLSLPSP